MNEVVEAMKKIIKLLPKTQTYHFIDMAKKVFAGNNLKNKETALLLLQGLAQRLRRNFKTDARHTLSIILDNLKMSQKQMINVFLNTF